MTLAPGAGPDTRSYRVDFAKSARLFEPRGGRCRQGIDEILAAYTRQRAHARGVPLPALPAPPPPPGAGRRRRARRRTPPPARARMSSRDTPLERMPVVILAGGLGTRLREETERVPKPLVGIGERPILWHIMKLFGHHGAPALRALPRLQELADQGVLPPLPRADRRPHRRASATPARRRSTPTARRTGRSRCAETGLRHRHRRAHPPRARSTSTPTPSSSPTATASAASTSARCVDFHRSHGPHRHRHRRPPDLALRRDEGRRRRRHRVRREAHAPPRASSRGGFFVFQREFFDYLDDDPELMFERAPLQQPGPRRRARRLPPHAASGWGWTPTASSPS